MRGHMDAEGLLDWAERILVESDAIDHWQKGRERLEAEELLEDVLGHEFYLDDDIPLEQQADFEKAIVRREKGEPNALIMGYSMFAGLKLVQRPGTFIPRDSSEWLATQAISRIKRRGDPVAIDLACGIGPVALAIKKSVQHATVVGTDLDDRSIKVARENSRRLGLDARFVVGDLFSAVPRSLRGRVDAITIHPPYVAKGEMKDLPDEILRFEPRIVLTDGSSGGLGLVERTVRECQEWLQPGGWLCIEVSPDRARQVMSVMRRGGLRDVTSTVDKGFKVTRVLVGRL